jgi:hypothetical protein
MPLSTVLHYLYVHAIFYVPRAILKYVLLSKLILVIPGGFRNEMYAMQRIVLFH